jgi:hypothetical protein
MQPHQQVLDANAGHDLEGLPGPVNVPGHGPLHFHSNGDIQRVANEYNARNGLGTHPNTYTQVDPAKGAQVAQAYDEMEHNPNDPEVKEAYDPQQPTPTPTPVQAAYDWFGVDHDYSNGFGYSPMSEDSLDEL